MVARRFLCAAGVLAIIRSVTTTTCSEKQSLSFSRWPGVAPEETKPVFLYVAHGNEASLPATCLAQCRDLPECSAVALLHEKGQCYGMAYSSDTLLRVDNSAIYFEKICIELPPECARRWWSVEITPGYRLHTEGRLLRVMQNTTVLECYEAITKGDQPQLYRSAQWVASNDYFEPELIKKVAGITGDCIFNSENKFTEPESYRVANYHTLYIENQCRHDYPDKIDRCSYEEYYNQTLKRDDWTVQLRTKDECKTACELEQRFVCRGFSWKEDPKRLPGTVNKLCSLHSDDLLTTGSWLMRRASNVSYYRRVICLNITVECNNEQLTIRYQPRGVFRGLVYVPGRSDVCGARAVGGRVTLTLPLLGDCDVNFAYSLTNGPSGLINRTMAYVMVMVQNNPIIQTAGDRWVRVGCSPLPPASNQQVQTTVSVTQHNYHGNPSFELGVAAASAVFNNSAWSSPPLTMYIVRPDSDATGTAVSLGELLELRIETTEVAEIEAYHLVASSRLGDSSVLLLDSQGCATGQVDFPEFSHGWYGKTQRLWARFKAFRFPTSHVVRFAIMIRFCDGPCAPKNCGKSRATRDTNEISTSRPDENVATVREDSGWSGKSSASGVLAQSGPQPCGPVVSAGRVPLELELVVGARDVLSADTLVRADHRSNIQESEALTDGLVCMHELVVVSLALSWLAVQLLLLVACCLLVKRYRNLAEMSMQKEYQSFDNVGFDNISTHRRVHWPDQNVDILHAS